LEDRNDLMSFVGVHLMASSHAVCHIKKWNYSLLLLVHYFITHGHCLHFYINSQYNYCILQDGNMFTYISV
jgi:hypothetical protein